MTCSPARLAANRANAARSTGPRTEEGKARSRANAMKHGLAAEVVRTPEEERAAEEAGSASGPMAGWLGGEVAVLAMRIERARKVEERERERAALRAEVCWEDDRRREADRIGRGLARCPDRVVVRLRGTVQGCDWLIERWGWLRDAAGREGGWGDEQRALAFALRGIPEGFRGDGPGVEGQAAMAEAEIRALREVRKTLEGLDAFERDSSLRKLDDAATPELRRAIRYEAALHRRLRWCCEQLRVEGPPAATEPEPPAPPPMPVAPPPAPAARSRPQGVPEDWPDLAWSEEDLDDLERIMAGRFPGMLLPSPDASPAVAIAPTAHRRD